jgi:hypothetical protein
MLGLKSFRSAAVTLAGVELAHRIRKGQHLLPIRFDGRRPSLKAMWECALNPASKSVLRDGSCFPPMSVAKARRVTRYVSIATSLNSSITGTLPEEDRQSPHTVATRSTSRHD